MSKFIFILKSPPLSSSKRELYNPEFSDKELNSYIKSISDSFFLSNDFRKHYKIFFLTEIDGERYQIIFKGDELKFLGPSFFSAGNLLLRVINHIRNPNSKKGKLTPGISIQKKDMDWILNEYRNSKWYHIQSCKTSESDIKLHLAAESNVFLFGFEAISELDIDIKGLSLGPLEIDEQIIIINHIIESVN